MSKLFSLFPPLLLSFPSLLGFPRSLPPPLSLPLPLPLPLSYHISSPLLGPTAFHPLPSFPASAVPSSAVALREAHGGGPRQPNRRHIAFSPARICRRARRPYPPKPPPARRSSSHSLRSYSVSSSEEESRCGAAVACLARRVTPAGTSTSAGTSKVTPFPPIVSGQVGTEGTPRLQRSRAVSRDLVRDWNFDEVIVAN
uniref:Uncharacterized protein n=1 Tax=Zea mays TaxID=4577 RepID=A0A804QS19_MAIZE